MHNDALHDTVICSGISELEALGLFVKGRVGRETGVGGSEESRSWVNGIHGRG